MQTPEKPPMVCDEWFSPEIESLMVFALFTGASYRREP